MSTPNKINEVLVAAATFYADRTKANGKALLELVQEWTKVEDEAPELPTGFCWEYQSATTTHQFRLLNKEQVLLAGVKVAKDSNATTVSFPDVRGIWTFESPEEGMEFVVSRVCK
jgi:hypothetical protein